MTIKDLKETLEGLPDSAEVKILMPLLNLNVKSVMGDYKEVYLICTKDTEKEKKWPLESL